MTNDGTAHLLKMAVQITRNCGFQRDPESAANKAAAHIRKFWTPAMIEQLLNLEQDLPPEWVATRRVISS